MELRINLTVSCIQAAIADHFKVFFRNVTDEAFDEIHNRKSFFHICFVFVAVIVERNGIPVIAVDSGCGDHRSAKIPSNVFGDHFRVAEIRFGVDIEAVFVLAVAFSLDLFKRRSNAAFQFIEKSSTESITEIVVVKVLHMTPEAVVTIAAFRKKAVDVRIPFEIPAKSMKNHDVAGSEIFGMVEVKKHTGYHTGDRMKEAV